MKQCNQNNGSNGQEVFGCTGNFRAAFIDDLIVKPRLESQPLLAFMDQVESILVLGAFSFTCSAQGEAAAIVKQGSSKSSRHSMKDEATPKLHELHVEVLGGSTARGPKQEALRHQARSR